MRNRHFSTLPVMLILLLTAVACAPGVSRSGQPIKPVASITAPIGGSTFTVGQNVTISFGAADVKGVSQVELLVDGQPVRVEVVNPSVNSYVASHTWQPATVGSHLIEARTFNVDGAASDVVQVVVTVVESGAVLPPSPTPLPPEVPTPTPVLVQPTGAAATPLPPLPPSPTPVPANTKPTATALVALNVRSGPGLDYPVIGRLAVNQSAEITGRDQFSGWWQIVFASNSGDRGWIAAGGEFSTATYAEGVPVVSAGPPPASAPTATAVPNQLKPTIFSFTADRYSIAAGEQVKLSWDLANAEAAYLRYGNVEEGVVAPGSKTVAPTSDTVYKLVARNSAGETVAELTIKVGGATATPAPVLRDGKTRIANGQSVDFDQGIVQDSTGSGSDFLWDAQKQQFFPQGGATGALIGSSYDGIGLDKCLSVSYGQPITGVDGSTPITGCYRTNEGRYGKFYVSDWDLSGNLTITWLTWDYR
jgi:hypothetical protein